jgi:hypothetical protein
VSEPTVFQAMLARARADAAAGGLVGLSGGRILDHVPTTLAEAGNSCLVLVHAGAQPPDYTTEADYTESARLEWHCYGRGSVVAERIAKRVKAVFDPSTTGFATLDVDGAAVVSLLRAGYQVQPEAVTLDGELRNRAVVPYEVVTRETAPARDD